MTAIYTPPPPTAAELAEAERKHHAHPPIIDARDRFVRSAPSGITSVVCKDGKRRTVKELIDEASNQEGKRE